MCCSYISICLLLKHNLHPPPPQSRTSLHRYSNAPVRSQTPRRFRAKSRRSVRMCHCCCRHGSRPRLETRLVPDLTTQFIRSVWGGAALKRVTSPRTDSFSWSCDPTYTHAADNVLNVTHLSPFLSLINVRRLSLMSALRFSTMRSMQLSRTRERVWDMMVCQQMGHLSLRFLHSRMQCWQKLWAQFSVTDWEG